MSMSTWQDGGMYGEFLRRVRESRGMSQGQLAEVSGIGQPNISAYENDRRTPSLDVFNRLLVSCGYQVAADGGSTVLHLPFPPGAGGYPFDDLPPRLPDDPPDLRLPVRRHLSMRERGRILTSVIESADAIRAGRSRR
jgi:transcriptional regulator with XRE-family HTH domain